MPDRALAQVRAFLTEGTRTAKLATVSADGRPRVVPVWFVLDGDDLVFTTHEASQSAKAMRRDARVVGCVDDEQPPYSYVMVPGPRRSARTSTICDGGRR